jgi:hypothetical protein
MKLDVALETIILPALEFLQMDSPEARVMMLAIGLQESGMEARYQVLNNGRKGAAKGLWQFEKGGGVLGVMRHRASKKQALLACRAHGLPWEQDPIWRALEHDDILAAVFARLFLWTDPEPLPEVGDMDGAMDLYHRVWRPGKFDPDRWPGNYAKALEAV